GSVSSSGQKLESFFYLGSTMIGKSVNKSAGEVKDFYFITDHLGTTVEVLDSRARSVYQNDVSAFGVQLGASGLEDEEHELFYTGKMMDDDTGLYYFNARWYDPQLGRFVTEDPVRDGNNWFAYCGNNPINFVDPSGLYEVKDGDIVSEVVKKYNKDNETEYSLDDVKDLNPDADLDNINPGDIIIMPWEVAKDETSFASGEYDVNAVSESDGVVKTENAGSLKIDITFRTIVTFDGSKAEITSETTTYTPNPEYEGDQPTDGEIEDLANRAKADMKEKLNSAGSILSWISLGTNLAAIGAVFIPVVGPAIAGVLKGIGIVADLAAIGCYIAAKNPVAAIAQGTGMLLGFGTGKLLSKGASKLATKFTLSPKSIVFGYKAGYYSGKSGSSHVMKRLSAGGILIKNSQKKVGDAYMRKMIEEAFVFTGSALYVPAWNLPSGAVVEIINEALEEAKEKRKAE
ncbi:MAG: hypothetical protein JXR63_13375, partial [Spirochaetales bacterium]|nr:hypothetical protein [Spirochaetales bacterium]